MAHLPNRHPPLPRNPEGGVEEEGEEILEGGRRLFGHGANTPMGGHGRGLDWYNHYLSATQSIQGVANG